MDHWFTDYLAVKGTLVTLEVYHASTHEGHRPLTQSYGFCFKEHKILIGRKPAGKWTFPGGTIEKGETPEEALIREVKEEVDATISNIRLFALQEVHYPNNPRTLEGEHYYQLRYAATIESLDEQTPDPDIDQVWERKLIDVSDIPHYISWGDRARILAEHALQLINDR